MDSCEGNNASVEKLLLKNEWPYRLILKKAKLLLVAYNSQSEITFICDHTPEVLGIPSEEIMGKNIFQIMAEGDRQKIENVMKTASSNGSEPVFLSDISLVTPSEQRLSFDGCLVHLDKEEMSGFAIYLFDVTEKNQMKEELKQAHFELDSFVYRSSHDLRAPIASIFGLVNIAHLDLENITKYIDLIKQSAKRLDRFVDDIARFLLNERKPITYENFDPVQLIEEVLSELSYLKNFQSIQITYDLPEQVSMDRERTKIIFYNLISNSIKYAEMKNENPFVEVWIAKIRNALCIKVQDNGIGIKREFKPKIFDMFYRASDIADGPGLGLYLVGKIVDKLNGNISIDSEQGVGTSVAIYLPASYAREELQLI